jgi:ribosome-associated protein
MATNIFALKGDYIPLCDLLKTEGIAESGGQGKMFVADGIVTVDGKVELRKTAKIRAGQIVECLGQTVKVIAAK